MKILLSSHLKIRLKERKIPQSYPRKIVTKPDSLFVDTITNHQIAVKKLEYNGKLRPMVVAYDIIESTVYIITIHPSSEEETNNKLRRGRWIKHEKN